MKNKCCHSFVLRKVDLEQKKRKICKKCGFIDYKSPKIVAGSIIVKQGKYLLCRRAIHPGYGLWTLPSGYLDENENPKHGAIREAKEEVNIKIKIQQLLAIYTIKKRNIVQFMFLAKQINKTFKPGIETLEAKFFDFKEIPWKKIAFPSVSFTLRYYYKNKNKLKNSPIFHDFNGD